MLADARLFHRNTRTGAKQAEFLLTQQRYIALHSAKMLPGNHSPGILRIAYKALLGRA